MSSIPSNRPEYKVQSSRLTLADALVEYRRTHPEFGEQARAGSAAAAFFEGHDVCHVVFGCGTTPDEEVLADAWTLFGTDVSLSQFVGFLRLPEHTDIVRQVGVAGHAERYFELRRTLFASSGVVGACGAGGLGLLIGST